MKSQPVKGFEDKYVIFEDGKIFNKNTNKFTKITMYPNTKAYPKVSLFKESNIRADKRVHNLVAEHFIPNPNNYKIVNHIDGNVKNFHKDNLEWCTHRDNYIHARDILKTCAIGEKHPFSVLTNDDVRFIKRKFHKEKFKVSEIVKMKPYFTKSSVEKVCAGVNWKHLKDY